MANAKLAYALFLERFSGPRWDALAARGARVQRPLWASTSTKNPAYPDTLYVDELIGPRHGQHHPRRHHRRLRGPRHAGPHRRPDVDEARADLDGAGRGRRRPRRRGQGPRGRGRGLVQQVLRRAHREPADQGRVVRSLMQGSLIVTDDVPGRVHGEGGQVVPRAAQRRVLPRAVGRRHGPRLLRPPGRRTRPTRSTGGRSTSTGVTSAACRSTIPSPTTAWPARRCSTGSARPTPPIPCAATRVPTPTSCGSASWATSTSCTSASVPTATPRRSSPSRPPSMPTPGGWWS